MKLFGKKKQKFPTDSSPRSLQEIQNDYAQNVAKAGQTQYIIYAQQQELNRINALLLQINQEGERRQKLDLEAKQKEAAKAKEVKSED